MSRDLIWIAASLFAWGIGEGMFFFFQPLYLQQLGADPPQIGRILGIVGASMAVAHIPAGYLADRVGRRPLLWAAWMLGCLATGVLAISTTMNIFIIGMIMYAITSFVSGPLNSYITAARGVMSVGRALTLIGSTFNLGAVIGPLLGGWIGEHFGLHISFRFAFIFFIVSTLLILRIKPQPVEIHATKSFSPNFIKVFEPAYWRFLGIIFLAIFVMFLGQQLSQNFLQNERSISLQEIGFLLATRSLGVVLLNLSLGILNARLGFILAQFGIGLYALLIWKGSGLPWFIAGYFILGGYQTARALAMALARGLVRVEIMGLAYGLLETSNAIVAFAAPLIAGFLYSIQPDLVYPVVIGGLILSIIISRTFLPHTSKELI
jgi:predicted MFS family arabinose efflux permease